jgi:hypothetical protein
VKLLDYQSKTEPRGKVLEVGVCKWYKILFL